MGAKTGIAWTRSTFNPWIGCTEVSPGCDGCYARVLDARHRWGGATHWGVGVPRYERPDEAWREPALWNRKAAAELAYSRFASERDAWAGEPGFWPVFPSLCDPFDNEVPEELHCRLWATISLTPNLTWLLLTKRIGNAEEMIEKFSDRSTFPAPNVWIGASIVNRKEADRDLPKLHAVPAVRKFISYEPALEAVEWGYRLRGISQLIVGGESRQGGHEPRPFFLDWARSSVAECREHGVAPFVKQLGARPMEMSLDPNDVRTLKFKDRAGADPAEWPEDLRVQEWPK